MASVVQQIFNDYTLSNRFNIHCALFTTGCRGEKIVHAIAEMWAVWEIVYGWIGEWIKLEKNQIRVSDPLITTFSNVQMLLS